MVGENAGKESIKIPIASQEFKAGEFKSELKKKSSDTHMANEGEIHDGHS